MRYVLGVNSKYEDLRFSNFYHHICLFYEHLSVDYFFYVLAILFYEIFLPWKQDLGHSENLQPQCSNTFYFHCTLAWFVKKSFVITIKIIVQYSKCPCLNLLNFRNRLGWTKCHIKISINETVDENFFFPKLQISV